MEEQTIVEEHRKEKICYFSTAEYQLKNSDSFFFDQKASTSKQNFYVNNFFFLSFKQCFINSNKNQKLYAKLSQFIKTFSEDVKTTTTTTKNWN